MTVTIDSGCAHCDRTLRIQIDRELRYRVEEDAQPLIRIPIVDFSRLRDPSIIDVF